MDMKRNAIIIAGLIVFNLCTPIASAQNVTRPKIACPNDIWVNSYNGVLFYQRTDFSIPGRSMPLEAVFYYNSSSNILNYGYGNGWSLGCEYRYIVDSTGVIIESGDGRQDRYAGAALEAPAGVFNTLSPLPSGGFALRLKDGSVYTFADTVSKRVTSIADRNNNILAFTYNDEGRLASISDASGRTIRLSWTGGMLASVATNLDNRRWEYAYDTAGNLTRVTNPMGYAVYYGYNRDNRINRFTDEAGYSTHITYNSDGMAHRVKTDLTDKSIRYEQASRQTVIVDYLTDGNNQFTTYRWDTLGRVIEKTGNCCGYTSRLEYDEDDNVVRSEDANGNVTTCTYDGNGNMLTLTDPLGYTERYTYTTDGYNNIATYTDKNGNQYTFGYDTHGNLTSINGPLGSQVQMTYDSHGQLLTQSDALGHTVTRGYDSHGNMVSVTDALGRTSTIGYDAFGNPVSQTMPSGATIQMAYDRMGRLTSTTDALGGRTVLSVDSRGRTTAITDALGQTTNFTLDALGQTLTVTDTRQATMTYAYNAKGLPTEVRDALNHATRMIYDDRDRVAMSIAANGDSTRYQYDAAGNTTSVLLPNGREIHYSYDALDRLVQTADQYGVMQTTVYDAQGNTVAVVDANGDTTHMRYDALGRLVETRNPMGNRSHYSYDLAGNLTTHTDANGHTTTFTYDAVGNMLTETDALNTTTTYTYDADGRLASVVDAGGNNTAYTYDANGQLTLITYADGKTRHFRYDAMGNNTQQQDEAGNIITMTYDAAGNMLLRSYADGSSDQFTYDLNGNMLSATNTNATVTFGYDAEGRMVEETLNGHSTTYTYDTRSGAIGITYPSGRQVDEKYDMRGRLISITSAGDTVARMEYDANDLTLSRTYGNGDVTSYGYDAAGRLISIAGVHGATPIVTFGYSHDPVGNILAKTDAIRAERSETYTYDAKDRLAAFRRGVAGSSGTIPNPLQQVAYQLDALGNRTTAGYSHDNTNAYTTALGATLQYDGNGNLTSDGLHTYQYNCRNRMVSVDSGATATYLYDALDRRIAANGTNYYYRGIQAIEERDGTDTTTYVYGNAVDDIVAMRRGGQAYYYHKDHIGSVMAITDGEGSTVEIYSYDPYGAPTIYDANGTEKTVSDIGNTIMFTGREYDYATGLYHYRARALHPQLGRFMQKDPLMYVDGYNMYEYVGGNPVNSIDPHGLLGLRRVLRVLFSGSYNTQTGTGDKGSFDMQSKNYNIQNIQKGRLPAPHSYYQNGKGIPNSIFVPNGAKLRKEGYNLMGFIISASVFATVAVSTAPTFAKEIEMQREDCSEIGVTKGFDWDNTIDAYNANYELINPWGEYIGGTIASVGIGLGAYAAFSTGGITAVGGFLASEVLLPTLIVVGAGTAVGAIINAGLNSQMASNLFESYYTWQYERKYGKEGMLKTPVIEGGVTYIENR